MNDVSTLPNEQRQRLVTNWLQLLVEPGSVVELRVLDVEERGWPREHHGFFDNNNLNEMARQALRLTGKASACYWTVNPVNSALLARCENKVQILKKGQGTGDKHVEHRRWLLIDADPVRVSGVSSTDAEKAQALNLIHTVRDYLGHRAWPAPILADSGNGYHLLYRIDLPALDDNTTEQVLKTLASRFDSDTVKVDQTVFNPSRICKLYGTLARKGSSTKDRPHRWARILEIPGCTSPDSTTGANVETVPAELVRMLADELPKPTKSLVPARTSPSDNNGFHHDERLLVDRYLAHYGYGFAHEIESDGSNRYRLDRCPFNADHVGKDVAIFQQPNGRLGAKCFHNSCSGKGWKDFRAAIGEPLPDHWDPARETNQHRRGVQPFGAATSNCSPQEEGKEPSPEGLPSIQANEVQLRDVRHQSYQALVAGNNPLRYFRRGGYLHRLDHKEGESPALTPLDKDVLLGELTNVANFVEVRHRRRDDIYVPANPPANVVKTIPRMPDWPEMPRLDAILEGPSFDCDGRLIMTSGYHPQSRLYLHLSPGLEIPAITDRPTTAEISAAKDLIVTDLLGDFPFADDASRAHAVAALLLLFCRPMIDGPTPLHLFDAPTPGSGKTLLAEVITLTALGREAAEIAEAKDADEWRKLIFAELLAASQVIFLDNLNRVLDSGSLASTLTSTRIRGRILGESTMRSAANTSIWLASGNNTVMSREMLRRTLISRIDPKTENPEDRKGFRHPDLCGWVRTNRPQLLHASMTLIQAWVAAGKPPGKQTLGKFEGWARVIGGILDVVGIGGLLANAAAMRASRVDVQSEWQEFVAAWWNKFGGEEKGVKNLFDLATGEKLLDSVLGDKGERSQRTRFGCALRKKLDCVIGRYRVRGGGKDHSDCKLYTLETVEKDGVEVEREEVCAKDAEDEMFDVSG